MQAYSLPPHPPPPPPSGPQSQPASSPAAAGEACAEAADSGLAHHLHAPNFHHDGGYDASSLAQHRSSPTLMLAQQQHAPQSQFSRQNQQQQLQHHQQPQQQLQHQQHQHQHQHQQPQKQQLIPHLPPPPPPPPPPPLPSTTLPSQQHQQHQQLQNPQNQNQQQPYRSVKRPRPVKSCTECRKRKLRCDRMLPCSQCQKSTRVCKYAMEADSSTLSDGSDVDVADVSRSVKRPCPTLPTNARAGSSETVQTPAKSRESPRQPLLQELSQRMERLEKQIRMRSPTTDLSSGRISIGTLDTLRGVTVKRGARGTRFFGQSSPRVMLNLFDEAKAFLSSQSSVPGHREVLARFEALHKSLQKRYHDNMAAITVFVDSMMPVRTRMKDILPNKAVCDGLVASYLDTSETIYRIIHIPTFREQYDLYWEAKLQSDSFLPQLLSILSIASRFETKSKGLGHERVEGVHIPTACALVRTWLDGLKGKQLVDMTTLQVELLLLHAQRMITPRAQDSWTQLGFIVRLAMTMGMHRDPSESEPRMTVFVGELRRRLWFTIIDMDLHMSLACNLPCLVRDGDYSCRPPRNLDDSELYEDMAELPPTKPIDQETDNQMQVYAAMTLGTRMRVAPLINNIDNMRDYQEVIDVGAKLERFLDDINYIFPRHGLASDGQRSKQWRSRVILDMHVRRPLLALYRPLAMGVSEVPAQISRAYLRSSMVILKYLDELDPRLAHFNDIAEMYHQILKRDIIQAAMSVCFYIQSAVRPNSVSGQQALRMSPDSTDGYPSYKAENLVLWSPVRLIQTVEKTLDLLISHMSGSDAKDILSLATVLGTVRTLEPRSHEIIRDLHRVLDACLMETNMAHDKVHSHSDRFQSDSYLQGGRTTPYGYTAATPTRPSSSSNNMPSSHKDEWVMWPGWDG